MKMIIFWGFFEPLRWKWSFLTWNLPKAMIYLRFFMRFFEVLYGDFKSFLGFWVFVFFFKDKNSLGDSWGWGGIMSKEDDLFLRCFEVFLSTFDDHDHFWHAMTWNLFSHADTFFWVVISFWGFFEPPRWKWSFLP